MEKRARRRRRRARSMPVTCHVLIWKRRRRGPTCRVCPERSFNFWPARRLSPRSSAHCDLSPRLRPCTSPYFPASLLRRLLQSRRSLHHSPAFFPGMPKEAPSINRRSAKEKGSMVSLPGNGLWEAGRYSVAAWRKGGSISAIDLVSSNRKRTRSHY